jgi:DNA invertase Pin-like site-specific DNA recombinase
LCKVLKTSNFGRITGALRAHYVALIVSKHAAVAEMERDLLVERTQAGLVRAKSEGKIFGRPSKTTQRGCMKSKADAS